MFTISVLLSSTAAVSVRTFLLHFKAPRRLMSYPRIMKGEILLGFEIGAERVSSSHLSLFLLSSSRVQGTSQHFLLGGSSTGLRISRSFDWSRCFLSFFFSFSFFITCGKKSLIVPFWPIKNRHKHIPLFPLCWDVFEMGRGDYCCSTSSFDNSSSWLLSSARISEHSSKALSHL